MSSMYLMLSIYIWSSGGCHRDRYTPPIYMIKCHLYIYHPSSSSHHHHRHISIIIIIIKTTYRSPIVAFFHQLHKSLRHWFNLVWWSWSWSWCIKIIMLLVVCLLAMKIPWLFDCLLLSPSVFQCCSRGFFWKCFLHLCHQWSPCQRSKGKDTGPLVELRSCVWHCQLS